MNFIDTYYRTRTVVSTPFPETCLSKDNLFYNINLNRRNKMRKCQICNKICESNLGLGVHIKSLHKISSKKYYDDYLKTENEDMCVSCGMVTNYVNLTRGYFTYCSTKCSANSIAKKDKIKKTCMLKYGNENPNQFILIANL